MKKLLPINNISIILIFAILTSCKSTYNPQADFQRRHLEGKIKSIHQKTYDLIKADDTLKKGKVIKTENLNESALLPGDELNLTKFIYNKDGTKHQKLTLDENDTITEKTIFYNEKGKLKLKEKYDRQSSVTRYMHNGKFKEEINYSPFFLTDFFNVEYNKDLIKNTYIFIYNRNKNYSSKTIIENGNPKEVIYTDDNDNILQREKYFYNEENYLTKKENLNASEVIQKEIYRYDTLNRIKQRKIYDFEGKNIIKDYEVNYSYNGISNYPIRLETYLIENKQMVEIKDIRYERNKKDLIEQKMIYGKEGFAYEYKYDNKGNWIEKKIFELKVIPNRRIPLYLIERKIEYF